MFVVLLPHVLSVYAHVPSVYLTSFFARDLNVQSPFHSLLQRIACTSESIKLLDLFRDEDGKHLLGNFCTKYIIPVALHYENPSKMIAATPHNSVDTGDDPEMQEFLSRKQEQASTKSEPNFLQRIMLSIDEHSNVKVLMKSWLLSNHDSIGIRKQKFIGTRKHESEAGETSPGCMIKDSDGSTGDVSTKNVQRMSNQMKTDDGDSGGDDSTRRKRRGNTRSAVEP